MDVGMMMIFAAYGWDDIDDDHVWDEELRLARIAADSGFDALWSAEAGELARKHTAGAEKAAVWGTPERILCELESPREVIGEFELDTAFRFGGIPYDTAEASRKLFAKEVLPVLQSWKHGATHSMAAQ